MNTLLTLLKPNAAQVGGIIRHALAAAFIAFLTAAVVRGDITQAQLQTVADHWQDIVAAVGFVGTVGWSLLVKRNPKVAAEVAEAAKLFNADPTDLADLQQAILQAAKTGAPTPAIAPAAPLPLPKNGPAGFANVKLLAVVLAVAVVLLWGLDGCATLNTAAGQVPASLVTAAAASVKQVTQDGVAALLAHHPNFKGDIVIADQALNTFVAAGGTDPVALRTAILADIPAADATDFSPLVDACIGAYQLYAAQWVQNETAGQFAADAKTLTQAIDAGLQAALAAAPPPTGAG